MSLKTNMKCLKSGFMVKTNFTFKYAIFCLCILSCAKKNLTYAVKQHEVL